MGVGRGERVAIVSPNSARFVVALFGVSAFGRVLVPVNFRLNADEVGYIVGHSGARVVLIDPELDAALGPVRRRPPDPARRRPGRGADGRAPTTPWSSWEPDEDAVGTDQLHVGHHRPAEGRGS